MLKLRFHLVRYLSMFRLKVITTMGNHFRIKSRVDIFRVSIIYTSLLATLLEIHLLKIFEIHYKLMQIKSRNYNGKLDPNAMKFTETYQIIFWASDLVQNLITRSEQQHWQFRVCTIPMKISKIYIYQTTEVGKENQSNSQHLMHQLSRQ